MTNLIVDVTFLVPKFTGGTTVQCRMNVTWTGFVLVYLWDVECEAPYQNWNMTFGGLPLTLTSMTTSGQVTLPFNLTVPANLQAGTHPVPCRVTFATQQSAEKVVVEYLNLVKSAPAEPATIPTLMIFLFIAMLVGAVPVFAVFRNERKKRSYST